MNKLRTVGDTLRLKREKDTLSLDQVAEATRIKKRYLEAIEKGHWHDLPPPTFTKGLIRNYAKHLGLSGDEIVAIFRREFDERKAPVKQTRLLQEKAFHFTPQTLLRIAIIILILGFVGYFVEQYQTLTGPPKLHITLPADSVIITGSSVDIVGSTSPEAQVKVNDQAIMVNPDGSFQVSLDIVDTTTVTIVATAKSGKSTRAIRTIVRKRDS